MNNKEKYIEIFEDIFGVDKNVLNGEFNFLTVEKWDSLTHLALITQLEDTFEIMFETDDILHFGGFENGMKILKKYGINFEG